MAAVHTVLGPIESEALGQVLMHEHLIFELPGWELNPFIQWDRQDAIDRCIERLQEAKALGLGAFVDLTAIGVCRDIPFMQEVANGSGVPVIACTGWWLAYGTPAYFDTLSIEQLAEIMIRELTEGVAGTDVRAGIIKVAASENTLEPFEEKVHRAAGRAQKATGCVISTHTSRSTAGETQIDLFQAEGADLAKVIIGHSDDRIDSNYHRRLLARGVTVQFDHIGSTFSISDAERADMLTILVNEGHADHLTLSHDTVGDLPGRPEATKAFADRRPSHIFATFLPMLRERGVSEDAIQKMLVDNPAKLLPF